MGFLLYLKRPFIWLSRFRHRCGYGVHSPFAFGLITDVVYERRPYYAYANLKSEGKKRRRKEGRIKGYVKVNRLLFRLVNRIQPVTIVEVGPSSIASLYMQAAKKSAGYVFASNLSELVLEADTKVDFLYLNRYRQPEEVEKIFDICAGRVSSESLFVVHGICYSKPMRDVWRRLKEDERAGVTFDLYDVGLIFFDRRKFKQHYVVNF